jgi:hypothetical protein
MVTMEFKHPYLNSLVAVVLVQGGETDEEAWHRHVESHPEHLNVNIRIFHRQ